MQRLCRLSEYREHHVDGQRPTLRHHLRERLARNQFHDEVRDTRVVIPILAIVEDAGDTGMGKRRRVSGLGTEPREKDRRIDEVVTQDLDRNLAPEDGVGRRPHLAHATDCDALCQRIPIAQHRRCRPTAAEILRRLYCRHVFVDTQFYPRRHLWWHRPGGRSGWRGVRQGAAKQGFDCFDGHTFALGIALDLVTLDSSDREVAGVRMGEVEARD